MLIFVNHTFFTKLNQRKPETHLYKSEYHMIPNQNLHLCYILHLLSLFLQMKPILCTPPGGEANYRDKVIHLQQLWLRMDRRSPHHTILHKSDKGQDSVMRSPPRQRNAMSVDISAKGKGGVVEPR